ncbi:MAG TPA: asparagine synthase (glutamine-hydrolyzing) [Opitutus sp.]|nr:asparagine synthase (glutamine-hydrolyzing) [Opitutus sp.]
MCGIAGVVDPSLPIENRDTAVARMCSAMVHRGPDDAGAISVGAASLGMRRLAVFDPVNGRQPMASADRRFHLVFNGAIYNFRALATELAGLGHSFATQCDTEVLLAAFAQWGEACVGRLRGMFAFAIWDAREERLFLARDPFGIKPLYLHQSGSRLLFASELNALVASGIFRAEIDPLSAADYLAWLAVPAPRTIYRDVVCLQPGECATFHRGQLVRRTYWNFQSIAPAPAAPSREEFEAGLRAKLEDSIRAHLAADVPVGAFLSGGLDSAVIVGLMTRIAGRLKTFTIGFEEKSLDESRAAEATALHFGTDHQTRIVTGAEVAKQLPFILSALDQPTGDGINTYFASETAHAGGVTVALSGLGGDELFGGYPSFQDVPRLHRWLPWWRMLPAAAREPILRRFERRGARYRKVADMLRHARTFDELCSLQRRVFSASSQTRLLSADARNLLEARPAHHPALAGLAADLRDAGAFEKLSAWELRSYMADVLLRDSDVMSMRHSLELRVPFIDRTVIEWLWTQPARWKAGIAPKAALASAMRDLLPPDLLSRRKQGFSFPFARWMRRELRPFLDETFSAASVSRSGLFSHDAVGATWRSFLQTSDDRQWSRLWSLAILVDFANRRGPSLAVRSLETPPSITVASEGRPATSNTPGRGRGATRPQPRRTVLWAPEIFTSEGGIPRILQGYLKALCELAGPDDQVKLLALNDNQIDTTDLERAATTRLTEWRVCAGRKSRFVRDALALSRNADRIVCGHIGQLPVALAARALNPALEYYLVAHGIEVWRPFSRLERSALRRAKRVFCVSRYTSDRMVERGVLLPEQAAVLPNTLDPFFTIAPGLPRSATDSPVILAVTRLTTADRYKGVDHLIEAMPAVRAQIPNAVLRVIGRGDDLPRLQALRARLGLGRAVEFLGRVDDARLAAELRACALFALPSEKEGFGLVLLEAMANGRPCLGARAGAIPELITDATGVLVEFGNVPAIADGCIAALRRTWDEDAILARAQQFSFERFKMRLAVLLGDVEPSSAGEPVVETPPASHALSPS